MSTVLFVAVAVAAGAIWPLHMWWSQRKGRPAACCPPARETASGDDLASLRARQQRLSDQIRELDGAAWEGERVARHPE